MDIDRSRESAADPARSSGPGSRGLRLAALALASLSLTLALAAVVAILSVGSARDARMAEGGFIRAADSTPARETTLVKMAIDHLREGRQYTVAFLSPGGEEAPLPPGIHEWPEPGTAVVSPELLRQGAGQGISSRYGPVTGVIDESGLADTTELLAYVRPVKDLIAAQGPDEAAVSGFGGSGTPIPFENVHWLLANQDAPSGALTWLVGLCAGLPSLWLALVASRIASHTRDRRHAPITRLDDRPAQRLREASRVAWRPVSLGALAALVVVTWYVAEDRRLPIVDYVVTASDLRGQWWAFGLCAVAAAGVVLCANSLGDVTGARVLGGERTRRRIRRHVHGLSAAAFPWFVALAAGTPHLFSDGHPAGLLTGYVGLIGIVLTMPAAISAGIATARHAVARWGRRRRSAALAAGARMATRPTPIARQVSGVGVYMVVLLVALTLQGTSAGGAATADAFTDKHGYSMIEVHPRGETSADEVSDFLDALPEEIEAVAYTRSAPAGDGTSSGDPQVRLTGSCPALTALALPCPDAAERTPIDTVTGPLTAWLGGSGPGTEAVLTVAHGTPSSAVADGTITLLAFTTSGDDIAAGILHTAGTALAFGTATSAPGETWRTGAAPYLEQSRWIVLIGGYGLVVLIVAASLGLAGGFLRRDTADDPRTGTTQDRRSRRLAAALVVPLPLTAAVATSCAVGYLAVLPMTPPGIGLGTPELVLTGFGTALFAGTVMWLWTTTAAPSSDDGHRSTAATAI